MAAAGWLGGLGVIVLLGVLGGERSPSDRDGLVADPAQAPAPSVASATRTPTPTDDAIVLHAPGDPRAPITTLDIVVRGSVRDAVGRVLVVLQARGSVPIVVATTEPMNATRTSWSDAPESFAARLRLPDPRPTGPAVIQIVTYDQRGRAQDVLLRPIIIGSVARLGEDGLGSGAIPISGRASRPAR